MYEFMRLFSIKFGIDMDLLFIIRCEYKCVKNIYLELFGDGLG